MIHWFLVLVYWTWCVYLCCLVAQRSYHEITDYDHQSRHEGRQAETERWKLGTEILDFIYKYIYGIRRGHVRGELHSKTWTHHKQCLSTQTGKGA